MFAYTVVAGDLIYTIATKFGVSVPQLLTVNPNIKDPNALMFGQTLMIPLASLVPSVDGASRAATVGPGIPVAAPAVPSVPALMPPVPVSPAPNIVTAKPTDSKNFSLWIILAAIVGGYFILRKKKRSTS